MFSFFHYLCLMVSVCSFNGCGLKMKNRRDKAILLCDADIICLQETHWDERCVEDVKKGWRGDVYVSNGGMNARGVAILVKTGVVENVKKVEDDKEGRMVGVAFDYMGEMFRLINIYAPNVKKRRKVFFEGLEGKCGGNSMIVGDFNVWCGRMDVSVGMSFKSDSSRDTLKKVMGENGMCDVWRERNINKRVFSRKQVVGGVLKQSRIDLLLCKGGIGEMIEGIIYKTVAMSDHTTLGFRLSVGCKGRGGGGYGA